MKKLIPICLLAIAAFSACKKGEAVIDKGCITQTIILPMATGVSPTDLGKIMQLFQQNNIPTTGLNFYRYTYDAGAGYAQPGPYETARASQIFNGLPVFNGDVLYNFRQGVLYNMSGNRYTAVNLNTTPRLTMPQLRSLYLAAMLATNQGYASLKDSCLTAQLGYYDLGPQNGQAPGQFIKAWKVNIGIYVYPVAYLRDDNDATLYIDNGIRTFIN